MADPGIKPCEASQDFEEMQSTRCFYVEQGHAKDLYEADKLYKLMKSFSFLTLDQGVLILKKFNNIISWQNIVLE